MVEKTLAECIDTKIMGGDSAMACPECGNPYGSVISMRRRNGDYIVSFEDESKEHTWDVRFHFHKGITYATAETMKNIRLPVDLINEVKNNPKNQFAIDKIVKEIMMVE